MISKRILLALGVVLFFGNFFLAEMPARAQNFAERYADCLGKHPAWTDEDCRWIAKGKYWEGMTPAQADAAEASVKEIAAQKKRAASQASSNSKNAAGPAAANLQPVIAKPETSGSAGAGIAALLILAIFALLYFIPGVVAQSRQHHQRSAIWVLNIFLGWTVIGWIAALVWASTETTGQQRV